MILKPNNRSQSKIGAIRCDAIESMMVKFGTQQSFFTLLALKTVIPIDAQLNQTRHFYLFLNLVLPGLVNITSEVPVMNNSSPTNFINASTHSMRHSLSSLSIAKTSEMYSFNNQRISYRQGFIRLSSMHAQVP